MGCEGYAAESVEVSPLELGYGGHLLGEATPSLASFSCIDHAELGRARAYRIDANGQENPGNTSSPSSAPSAVTTVSLPSSR